MKPTSMENCSLTCTVILSINQHFYTSIILPVLIWYITGNSFCGKLDIGATEFSGQPMYCTSWIWIPYDKLHLFNSKSFQCQENMKLDISMFNFLIKCLNSLWIHKSVSVFFDIQFVNFCFNIECSSSHILR